MVAIEGTGMAYIPDWRGAPEIRARKLVEFMPGWGGEVEGGDYAMMPPGQLIPAMTGLFVDEIAESIKAGWRS